MKPWGLPLKESLANARAVGKGLSNNIFAAGRLLILFITALLLVFSLAEGQVTATGLFQSPQSPPSEPPPEPTATPVPSTPVPADTPVPEATATPIPVEPAEEGATSEEGGEVASTEGEETSSEVAPTEEAVVEQQIEPTTTPLPITEESTNTQTIIEEATTEAVAPPGPQPVPIQRDPAPEQTEEVAGDSGRNLILDQAELIDTVAVSGAYIWLCCGIGLLLLAPLSLLFIYIRGRNKILVEESY